MIFNIKCNNQNLKIEAENMVQAIIEIIDLNLGIADDIEFDIKSGR